MTTVKLSRCPNPECLYFNHISAESCIQCGTRIPSHYRRIAELEAKLVDERVRVLHMIDVWEAEARHANQPPLIIVLLNMLRDEIESVSVP